MRITRENPVSEALLSGFALIFFVAVIRWSPLGTVRALSSEEVRELKDDLALLQRQGRWREAELPARELHEAAPNSHMYLQALAEIYDKTGHVEQEARMWEQFVQYAPLPGEACPQLPRTYEKQGRTEEAIRAFERCYGFDRTNSDNAFYLAYAYERAGRRAEATAQYERAHEANPRNGDLNIGLARMRLRQARPEEACQLAKATLASNPNHVDALLVAGMASRDVGDLTRAKEYLERGSKLADSYNDFHVLLAGIDEQLGDMRGALEHCRRATRSDKSAELASRLQRLEALAR
jgi:tetratricopeptide (TPR) repeat protein